MIDGADFIIINARFYNNIEVQINALKASIPSLLKNGQPVTDLILKLNEFRRFTDKSHKIIFDLFHNKHPAIL